MSALIEITYLGGLLYSFGIAVVVHLALVVRLYYRLRKICALEP